MHFSNDNTHVLSATCHNRAFSWLILHCHTPMIVEKNPKQVHVLENKQKSNEIYKDCTFLCKFSIKESPDLWYVCTCECPGAVLAGMKR
jgi:hypothetical protein